MSYGYHHYCHAHQQLVDAKHIDVCDCIKPKNYLVSDIISPRNFCNSIWEMDQTNLDQMITRLNALNKRLEELCENKVFTTI